MSEVSEPEDSDWKIFPLSLAAADDVCIKLDKLIQTGIIPKDKIMYKYLKDTVEVLIKYDHEYDHEVIEFFNTIEYLGGGRTVNFLRGPCIMAKVEEEKKMLKMQHLISGALQNAHAIK